MKFAYTIFYVQDVPATLAFYNKALGLETRFIHESNQYGELATGSTTLAFADEKMAAEKGMNIRLNRLNELPNAIGLSFRVPTAHTAFEEALFAGATAATPLADPDKFGATSRWFRDLNGIPFVIYSLPEGHSLAEELGPIDSIQFSDTVLIVPDINRTADFYDKAFGLGIAATYLDGLVHELETEDVGLLFSDETTFKKGHFDFPSNTLNTKPAGVEIALTTDDVAAAYKHALLAGATGLHAPKEQPWGQTVAWVRDCNGVIVELCTPMGS